MSTDNGSRQSVIELVSDSDGDEVQITGTSPAPPNHRAHSHNINGTRSPNRHHRLFRLAERPPSSSSDEPIVITSDVEDNHSDEEVQITGEQRLRPSQRRLFAGAPPRGFMLYSPSGPVYQADDQVRVFGVRRGNAGPRLRRHLEPYGRRVRTHGRQRSVPPQMHSHSHSHAFGGDFDGRGADGQIIGRDIMEDVLRSHFITNFLGGDERTDLDSSVASRVLRGLRARVTTFRGPNGVNLISLPSMGVQQPGVGAGEQDEIPRSIMDEIRRREQAEEDRRIRLRDNVANKMKLSSESKAQIPEEQKGFFSNGFSSKDSSVCVLCGVVLAEGIADDFKTCDDIELKKKLVLVDKFKSPWQYTKNITVADRDLSKKVFFGRCGHVYCGRCVNNISRHTKLRSKSRKRKVALENVSIEDLDLNDPEFSAPNRCVADDCNKLVTGRYFFRELFV